MKPFFLNNQFVYNPSKFDIAPSDIKILNFIKQHAHKNTTDSGRALIVEPEKLSEFLKCAENKKIQFKYNGVEYGVTVVKANLPVSFTLKTENDFFILTTHKKLPIPLTQDKSVYFFNDKLYLPSKEQLSKYNPLYDKFKLKGKIVYNKTLKNYNALMVLLHNISNDITLTEGVKSFAANTLNFKFFIYKAEENIYCKAYGNYNDTGVNILDKSASKISSIRNFNEETKLIMKLEHYNFIRHGEEFFFNGDYEDFLNILSKKNQGIYKLGSISLGNGLSNLQIYSSADINVNLYEKNDAFNLDCGIGDIKAPEFSNMLKAYKCNEKFYLSKDNKLIDLEDPKIKEFITLIDFLSADDNLCIEKDKTMFAAEAFEKLNIRNFKGRELLKNIENNLNGLNYDKISLPNNLKASLRDYQISGFRWFKNLSKLGLGGILADEMGLGKTVQTIAFILSELGKISLIIVPTSLLYNWKAEINKFAPILKVGIAHGTSFKYETLHKYDVILTTYGTLRNNIENFKHIKFDYCIIDEAQNIKNSSAQITTSVKKINAKIKFALTGTPIENNLSELWSIFDFIMPDYLYSKEIFDKKLAYDFERNFENLKLLIKPFILRRTKKEVIKDLPDKIEEKILVEMTPMQKLIYNSYIKTVRDKLKNATNKNTEIFSYLIKLRQICLDPSLVLTDYTGGSGKFKIVIELLEEQIASNNKVLLFSQFTSVLKKISELFKEKGIEYLYLDGSIPPKERINLTQKFNTSSKPIVFLISLKAGGTGLNLTAASSVIHFDPWWNPAVENQATDRAHRIGQKNVVHVIKLVARETIEEKIVLLQESKKELIESVINGDLKNSDAINKLTKEEMLELFSR
nr:DEAD/DEAH box helicase [Clostridium guangxiense]